MVVVVDLEGHVERTVTRAQLTAAVVVDRLFLVQRERVDVRNRDLQK